MKQFLEKLIDKPKGVYAIAVLVVIILVIYFVFKSQISTIFQEIKNSIYNKKSLDEAITQTGQSLSYTELQYQAYSNRLYLCMKGMGTDDEGIMSVFNDMRNTADVLKLVSVFGTRDNETLQEWLRGEDEWFDSIVKRVNASLTAKGITYQF
jgi:predicted PurR-regulated permease PerM